jgi:hypothetical protein
MLLDPLTPTALEGSFKWRYRHGLPVQLVTSLAVLQQHANSFRGTRVLTDTVVTATMQLTKLNMCAHDCCMKVQIPCICVCCTASVITVGVHQTLTTLDSDVQHYQ